MKASGSLITARVSEDIKAQGNLALQQAGYTPSQAVKALWVYAARCQNDPEELSQTLNSFQENEDMQKEIERKRESSRRIVESFTKLREKLGIDKVDLPDLPYKELRDMYYDEMLEEMQ